MNYRTEKDDPKNTGKFFRNIVVENCCTNHEHVFNWNNAKYISALNTWPREIAKCTYLPSLFYIKPPRFLKVEKTYVLILMKNQLKNSSKVK